MYRSNFKLFLLAILLLLPTLSLQAHLSTLPDSDIHAEEENEPATKTNFGKFADVRITLVDSGSGNSIAGLIRIKNTTGDVISISNLLNRGTGLKDSHPTREWYALIRPTTLRLPRMKLKIDAIQGLETSQTEYELDLTEKAVDSIQIPLKRFYSASKQRYLSGNTHLHLRSISKEQADRYLTQIPKADDLDLVFVSYLLRSGDDSTYISNEYTTKELEDLSTDTQRLGYGEEHRHNFGSYGEGYGHVMFLNISELIHPVSIGPGIMKENQTDGIPLQRGIQLAKQDGGTAIWCHNAYGFEDIPNWTAGWLDAQNIFDGGSTGTYEDTFYRYLNIGLKTPFSSGTDWFIYDFARVYVHTEQPFSTESWLNGLKQGRTFITNGPFLEFETNGKHPGDVIRLDNPTQLTVSGKAVGRVDFQNLELIHNGKVVFNQASQFANDHHQAILNHTLEVKEPGWLALRISSNNESEFEYPLFAHTSPIYIEIAGENRTDRKAVQSLIDEMKQSIETIRAKGVFQTKQEQENVLNVYTRAIEQLSGIK